MEMIEKLYAKEDGVKSPHIIKFRDGFVWAGLVPVVLVVRRRDGQPFTDDDVNLAPFSAAMYKDEIFSTREEALLIGKSCGVIDTPQTEWEAA
jgi:hypothetical protein